MEAQLGLPVMTPSIKKQEASKPTLEGFDAVAGSRAANRPQPLFNLWRVAFLGVLILALVAYLPALKGLRVWDDDALLNGNGIGGGKSLVDALTKPFLGAYFRPLVSLTFFIENKLWEGNPFLYHQTNILLHVFGCAALMGLVLTAFNKRMLALVSGLLFAVQPAQVSAVAWIGGRTDSLCALLVILFSYTLILGVRATGKRRFVWLSASLLAFFLAAVTKEQVVALILLVPLAAKTFANEEVEPKPNLQAYVRLTVPYAIASAVFAVLWFAFNPTPFAALGRGFVGQMLTAGRTTVYYTLLFLAPSGKWMHTLSLGAIENAGLPVAIAGLLLLSAMVVGVVICLRRNPKLGWFAALAALALLPVSNIVPLPSLLVAPYRAGIAGAAVAVLLAWALTTFPFRKAAYVVGGAFFIWCTWLTYWGSTQWAGPLEIFGRITTEDPYSIVARRNMSSYLMLNSKPEPAAQQLQTILTMLYGSTDWRDPDVAYNRYKTDKELDRRVIENQGNDVVPASWLSELFAQLGFAQNQIHQLSESKKSFEAAVRIDPKNPGAQAGLGKYAMIAGNWDLALHHFRLAVAVEPRNPSLHALLGQVLTNQGKFDQAKDNYQQAIEIEPWFGPYYQDFAESQVKAGDTAGALVTLKAALNCQVLDDKAVNARIAELENRKKG
jgi:hypothetical protein